MMSEKAKQFGGGRERERDPKGGNEGGTAIGGAAETKMREVFNASDKSALGLSQM